MSGCFVAAQGWKPCVTGILMYNIVTTSLLIVRCLIAACDCSCKICGPAHTSHDLINEQQSKLRSFKGHLTKQGARTMSKCSRFALRQPANIPEQVV